MRPAGVAEYNMFRTFLSQLQFFGEFRCDVVGARDFEWNASAFVVENFHPALFPLLFFFKPFFAKMSFITWFVGGPASYFFPFCVPTFLTCDSGRSRNYLFLEPGPNFARVIRLDWHRWLPPTPQNSGVGF